MALRISRAGEHLHPHVQREGFALDTACCRSAKGLNRPTRRCISRTNTKGAEHHAGFRGFAPENVSSGMLCWPTVRPAHEIPRPAHDPLSAAPFLAPRGATELWLQPPHPSSSRSAILPRSFPAHSVSTMSPRLRLIHEEMSCVGRDPMLTSCDHTRVITGLRGPNRNRCDLTTCWVAPVTTCTWCACPSHHRRLPR